MMAAETVSTGPTPFADLPEIFLTPAEHDQLSRLVGDHEASGAAGLLQQELDRATVTGDRPAHAVGVMHPAAASPICAGSRSSCRGRRTSTPA